MAVATMTAATGAAGPPGWTSRPGDEGGWSAHRARSGPPGGVQRRRRPCGVPRSGGASRLLRGISDRRKSTRGNPTRWRTAHASASAGVERRTPAGAGAPRGRHRPHSRGHRCCWDRGRPGRPSTPPGPIRTESVAGGHGHGPGWAGSASVRPAESSRCWNRPGWQGPSWIGTSPEARSPMDLVGGGVPTHPQIPPELRNVSCDGHIGCKACARFMFSSVPGSTRTLCSLAAVVSYSTGGDPVSDSKTTEQEPLHVRFGVRQVGLLEVIERPCVDIHFAGGGLRGCFAHLADKAKPRKRRWARRPRRTAPGPSMPKRRHTLVSPLRKPIAESGQRVRCRDSPRGVGSLTFPLRGSPRGERNSVHR